MIQLKTQEALELTQAFCTAYLARRDLEGALALVSEELVFIGTADFERIYGREAFRAYLRQEVQERPEPFVLEFLRQAVHAVGPDCAVADLKLRAQNGSCRREVILSATVRNIAGKWKLCHLHFSVPTPQQNSRDHYPVMVDSANISCVKVDLLSASTAGGLMGGYMEPNFPFYYINDWMLHYLGYGSEAEFIADNRGVLSTCIHPEDRARVDDDVARQLGGGEQYTVEYRMRKRSGDYIWVHDVGRIVTAEDGRNAILSVCIDITARKELEQALRTSQQRYALALEGAGLAVWQYDMTARRILVDDAAAKTYGFGPELDDIPESMIRAGVVREDSVDTIRALYRRLHEGAATASADVWFRRPHGGGWRCERITYSRALDEQGSAVRAYGAGADITAQKQREHRYQQELRYRDEAGAALLSLCHVNLSQGVVESCRYQSGQQTGLPYDETFRRAALEHCMDRSLAEELYELLSAPSLIALYNQGTTTLERSYQVLTGEGRWLWASTRINLVVEPGSDEIEAFFYTKDVTRELGLQNTVDTIIAVEYDFIFQIDAPSGKFRVVATKPGIQMPSVANLAFDVATSAHIRRFAVVDDLETTLQAVKLSTVLERLEQQPTYSCEMDMRDLRGVVRRKRLRFAYAHRGGGQIILTRTDIEEIVQAEKEKQTALREALRAAQEANTAKSEFMSRMSHDMRTPMNGILGLARLGTKLQTLDEAREYFARISESGDYLLLLINDTLEMNRIESGQLKLRREVIHGEKLFEEIVAMNRFAAESKGVDFVVQTGEVKWGYVLLDRERTLQVFNNLLGNAIKFTPPGGRVEMVCRQERGADGRNRDTVIIRDNGIGISSDFMPRLFQPFQQELDAAVADIPGTGLGLSIVKRLLELMDGEIRVRSEKGKGTEYTVSIAFEMAPSPEQPEVFPALREKNLSGYRVLLCEDHPLNVRIARKMLEDQNLLVEHAGNGRIGVERFAMSPPGYYSAILMDIRMPELDGMEATRQIRAMDRPDAATVPILAMTANAFAEDREQSRAAGMNDHLSKPVSPEELLAALRRWIP